MLGTEWTERNRLIYSDGPSFSIVPILDFGDHLSRFRSQNHHNEWAQHGLKQWPGIDVETKLLLHSEQSLGVGNVYQKQPALEIHRRKCECLHEAKLDQLWTGFQRNKQNNAVAGHTKKHTVINKKK